ncbi:MAG: hypothetical protein LBD25_05105 [Coriobacteriales bacterium]|nr:hypothetical protein [Coriobacteriales bacterium]
MIQLSFIGCLIATSLAVLLRINAPGLGPLALFCNILGYLLLGVALFVWLARVRPLRGRASRREQDRLAGLSKTLAHGRRKSVGGGSPEYQRYRRRWRLCLVVGGLVIVVAYLSLGFFEGPSVVPLVLLAASYLPLGAAVYLYRRHLKPLKQAESKEGADDKQGQK